MGSGLSSSTLPPGFPHGDRIEPGGALVNIHHQLEHLLDVTTYEVIMFADCSGGKKARAQAKFAASSETIDVLSSIAGLIRVMQKLHPAVVVNLKKVEEVDHAHAWLRGEISIFQDMVGNLLDNACRFARHKVNVTISASQELCIAIDDDGPGITPAQRVSVLRRGERLDESSPGSGLGLTISADLAELFGGKLLLEDSPLGGLRVRLLIPRATQEES